MSTEDFKNEIILRIESALGVKFSPTQLELILADGKPLNGLSCAGSGKTTTIIGKLLYMEHALGIKPERIIAISFNRAAVEEMTYRHKQASRKLGRESKVTFRTYHSLFKLILNYFYPNNEIADEARFAKDFNSICYRLMPGCTEEQRENVKSLRGYALNNLILSKDELLRTPKFATSGVDAKAYFDITKEYNELKKVAGVWDFDDLQLEMYKLCRDYEKARAYIQKAWDYWLIDEYQDVSKIQLEILKMIVLDPSKLITIGDDDQSIYEFRGSKVDYIVDMPLHFKGTHRIVMDTNYRCPENILLPIERSIKNNSKRVPKQMTAHNKGGLLRYLPAVSTAAASYAIANEIRENFEENPFLNSVAVLYRNLKQQMFIVDMLLEKNVPVKTNKTSGLIYNHFIVRDLRDAVDLALNETNGNAFQKVFSKITSFVSSKEIESVARKMKASAGTLSWRDLMLNSTKESVHEASVALATVKDLVEARAPFARIIEVLVPLYWGRIEYLAQHIDITEEDASEIIDYAKYLGAKRSYSKFNDYIERGSRLIEAYSKEKNAVTVTTMHTVKGLEYDRVYLLFASEDSVPSAAIEKRIRSEFGDQYALEYIEQERRLFYVAWTRARKELIVTFPLDAPSRFIVETLEMGQDLRDLCEPLVTAEALQETIEEALAPKPTETTQSSKEEPEPEQDAVEDDDNVNVNDSSDWGYDDDDSYDDDYEDYKSSRN